MKTAVIFHSSDLDGWMSAAIVLHWFKSNIQNDESYYIYNIDKYEKTTDIVKELCMIGYNYGDKIPDLSQYDQVIMCDISFPKEEMDSLKLKLKRNFIWIDHHISSINQMQYTNNRDSSYCAGLRDTNFAACELTWYHFFPNESIPEIVRLLGRYDSFQHKGTNEEQKVLEFQYGARGCISNHGEAYSYLMSSIRNEDVISIESLILEDGETIYDYLCTEAQQTYKNGFEIEFKLILQDEEHTDCIWYKFICINKERFNPINFGIDYHKDGYDGCACFHYANGMWNFSLYNDNGQVDCSAIAKQYGGGGHRGASGFRLNHEQFLSLIK